MSFDDGGLKNNFGSLGSALERISVGWWNIDFGFCVPAYVGGLVCVRTAWGLAVKR
jgi:hypothetical protein